MSGQGQGDVQIRESGQIGGLLAATEDAIRGGVSWWLGELAGMIPWRPGRNPAKAAAILDLAGGEPGRFAATLSLAGRGGAASRRLPVELTDPSLARAEVRAALRDHGLGSAVVIRLAPSLLLEAEVSLPPGAERALRPILVNQLDRLVPLPAEAVDFDYSVAPRKSSARSLRVHLTIVARATVAQAVDLARSLGLAPRLVFADSAASWSGAAVMLWREGRAGAQSSVQRRLRRGLEIAAIVLFATAFLAYIDRLDRQLADLEEDVRNRARLATAARDLSRQQQQVQGALEMLQKRQRELTPLQVLDEVTNLVPLDSWLSRLSVRGRKVEVIGNSPHVAELVARLDHHEIFWDPQFLSPVTAAPDGKTQRFNLSFQIWLEGDPE